MLKQDIETEIANITSQIVKKYRPEKIILFGSAARGELSPDSDLDFFIIKDDKRRHIERMKELYFTIKYNIATDFLVYRPQEIEERLQMGDPFIKQILNEGRILYS